MWLDDLYPRAKFADGLAIIEKLGHKKRMQVMRKEWISESKLKRTEDVNSTRSSEQASANERRSPLKASSPDQATNEDAPADHDGLRGSTSNLDAAGNQILTSNAAAEESLFIPDGGDEEDQPPEDDLDAILAESEARRLTINDAQEPSGSPNMTVDHFADDEEAMAGGNW